MGTYVVSSETLTQISSKIGWKPLVWSGFQRLFDHGISWQLGVPLNHNIKPAGIVTSNIIHWKKHCLIDQHQKTLTINCIKQNTQDSMKITTIIKFHRRLVQRPILYQDQRPTQQMEVVLDVWNAGNVRFWLHLLVTIFVGVIIWQRVYIEISCMDLCFLLGPPVAPNLCQFVSSKTAILIRSVPNQLASIVVQGLVQIHYLQYSDMQGEQNNATQLRDGYPQILQSSF